MSITSLNEANATFVVLTGLIKAYESQTRVTAGLNSPEVLNDFLELHIPYFAAQRGRQGDVGDTGIRNEAWDLIREKKAEGEDLSMEDALKELMKDAKRANDGKGDAERIDRIKSEQKQQQKRRSRETKDKKK